MRGIDDAQQLHRAAGCEIDRDGVCQIALAGRDPDALELSLGHMVPKIDLARAAKLGELGAHRIVLAMPPVTDLDEAKDTLSACAERLALTR